MHIAIVRLLPYRHVAGVHAKNIHTHAYTRARTHTNDTHTGNPAAVSRHKGIDTTYTRVCARQPPTNKDTNRPHTHSHRQAHIDIDTDTDIHRHTQERERRALAHTNPHYSRHDI